MYFLKIGFSSSHQLHLKLSSLHVKYISTLLPISISKSFVTSFGNERLCNFFPTSWYTYHHMYYVVEDIENVGLATCYDIGGSDRIRRFM